MLGQLEEMFKHPSQMDKMSDDTITNKVSNLSLSFIVEKSFNICISSSHFYKIILMNLDSTNDW